MPIPKKELYSIAELIEHWRWWGCDRSMLLEHARRDTLLFSIYLRDIGSHQRHEERPDGNYIVTTSVMKFVSPDFQSSSSVRYLSSEDARRILEASENVRIAVSVLYDTVERTKSQAMAYLQTRYFTVDDLAITGIEIDRFEREHKLQEARYLPRRFFTWLSETNNQRTLGILSAGVAGLSAAVWAIYRHFFG